MLCRKIKKNIYIRNICDKKALSKQLRARKPDFKSHTMALFDCFVSDFGSGLTSLHRHGTSVPVPTFLKKKMYKTRFYNTKFARSVNLVKHSLFDTCSNKQYI